LEEGQALLQAVLHRHPKGQEQRGNPFGGETGTGIGTALGQTVMRAHQRSGSRLHSLHGTPYHLAALVGAQQPHVPREEHGPSDDGDEEVAGLADELEGAAQLEQGLDVQVALVVRHEHHRRAEGRRFSLPTTSVLRPVKKKNKRGEKKKTNDGGARVGPQVLDSRRQAMQAKQRGGARAGGPGAVGPAQGAGGGGPGQWAGRAYLLEDGGAGVGPEAVDAVLRAARQLIEDSSTQGVDEEHDQEEGMAMSMLVL